MRRNASPAKTLEGDNIPSDQMNLKNLHPNFTKLWSFSKSKKVQTPFIYEGYVYYEREILLMHRKRLELVY